MNGRKPDEIVWSLMDRISGTRQRQLRGIRIQRSVLQLARALARRTLFRQSFGNSAYIDAGVY
jgi:hypothetical protein